MLFFLTYHSSMNGKVSQVPKNIEQHNLKILSSTI